MHRTSDIWREALWAGAIVGLIAGVGLMLVLLGIFTTAGWSTVGIGAAFLAAAWILGELARSCSPEDLL